MPNLIQIKRSLTTAAPGSLANGELAFTANGDVLYIGSNSVVVPIGGKRTPGVLTANQALVANATSGIDKVIVANLVPTVVWANGAAGSAGQFLTSNSTGVYWSTPASSVAGTDTQIQFNDGGSLAGDAGLTFNKTTDTLSTNSIFATSTVNAATLSVGTSITANSTKLAIGTGVGLEANGGIGSAGEVLHSNGTSVYWATDDQGVTSVVTGNGLTGGTITATGTVSVLANNGITANATGLYVTAANGISTTADGVNVLAGTGGGLVSNSTGVFVTAGDGLLANATGVHVVAGNGISVSADALAVNGGSTLTVNSSGVHVNNNLSITDLSVSGNLSVLGTLSTIDTTNLVVKDSMIELANGNVSADLLDIGLYGQYSATGTRFTGIFRDASDGVYKLFSNSTVEPTTTVDTGATGYVLATLQSYLTSGGLVSNATNIAITANSTLAVALVANTLSLTTALPGTSGGTGLASYTAEDILVANSSNGFRKLSIGTSGYVLQSNGSALVYDTLDGGTF